MLENMIPKNRRPTTPGETIREEFLEPMNLPQQALADATDMDRAAINEIINGKRSITPNTAMRLGHVFGTTAAFWLNLQLAVDLYDAMHENAEAIERLPVLVRA
jgi:addiction module HigA family antidote